MNIKISRSISEPIRTDLSWGECWKAEDQGLIKSWEVGREIRVKQPELAARAEQGELPVLDWKGGIDKPLKSDKKYGSYFYVAQLQGLKGENLEIDTSTEIEIFCSRTGVKVIYTFDIKKYGAA